MAKAAVKANLPTVAATTAASLRDGARPAPTRTLRRM